MMCISTVLTVIDGNYLHRWYGRYGDGAPVGPVRAEVRRGGMWLSDESTGASRYVTVRELQALIANGVVTTEVKALIARAEVAS